MTTNRNKTLDSEFIISGIPWTVTSTASTTKAHYFTDVDNTQYYSQWVSISNTGTSGSLSVAFVSGGIAANTSLTVAANTTLDLPIMTSVVYVSGAAAQPYNISAGITRAKNPNSINDESIQALLPYSWMDAATYTVDGATGKVGSFPDKVAANTGIKLVKPDHAFTQTVSAKQTAVPTVDALLNNAFIANFNASPFYTSNASVAEWKCAHDGTGFESFVVLNRNTITGVQYSWSTYATTETGAGAYIAGTTLGSAVYNGSTLTFNATALVSAVGTSYNNTATNLSDTPDATLRLNTTSVATANASAGFSSSNSVNRMTLGAFPGGSSPLDAKVAMILFFNRVLTTAERTIVQTYISQKYGF